MNPFFCWSRLFRRRRAEEEFAEELRFHLEASIEAKVAGGMDPEVARKETLREFGGVEQVREEVCAGWGLLFIHDCWKDIRHGWRQLCRNKWRSVIIVLTLSVCIGLYALSSLLHYRIVDHPYDYPDMDRAVRIGLIWPKSGYDMPGEIWPSHYRYIAQQSESFALLGLCKFEQLDLSRGDGALRRVSCAGISPDVWDIIGARPVYGRLFTDEDIALRDGKTVVLNESLWKELKTPGNDLMGEDIELNGERYTIIGVTPKNLLLGVSPDDVYIPKHLTEEDFQIERSQILNLLSIGKLKPGIPIEQANAELDLIYESYLELYPQDREYHERYGQTFGSVGIVAGFSLENHTGPAFKIIRWVALTVLLIGCLNVAGMVLVGGYTRLQELAMRRALGATTGRLIRQILIETALYFILGMMGSILVYKAGCVAAPLFKMDIVSFTLKRHFDWHLSARTIAVVGTAMLFTGLLPAIVLLRRDLMALIKAGSRTTAGAVGRHRVHALFVVVQVALSFLLLAGTGLLIANMHAVLQKELGVEREGRVALYVPLPRYRFPKGKEELPKTILPFEERAMSCLRSMPGVLSVSTCSQIPMGSITGGNEFTMDHHECAPDEPKPLAARSMVHPGYFKTIGTRLLMGRDFNATDTLDSEGVVIISQGIMEKYYTDLNPVGMMIRMWKKDLRIVGVAEKVQRTSFDFAYDQEDHALYLPRAQWHSTDLDLAIFVAQVKGDPEAQKTVLERALLTAEPQITVHSYTYDELYETATHTHRLPMQLTSFFSIVALLMTGLGLYGLISFVVAERTREYGIRMALGAQPALILSGVLKRTGRLVGLGLLIGLSPFGLLAWKINPLFPDVNTLSPLNIIVSAIFVGAIGMAAGLFPALRATRIHPMESLRAE